jgi:hypothetical protein
MQWRAWSSLHLATGSRSLVVVRLANASEVP